MLRYHLSSRTAGASRWDPRQVPPNGCHQDSRRAPPRGSQEGAGVQHWAAGAQHWCACDLQYVLTVLPAADIYVILHILCIAYVCCCVCVFGDLFRVTLKGWLVQWVATIWARPAPNIGKCVLAPHTPYATGPGPRGCSGEGEGPGQTQGPARALSRGGGMRVRICQA